MEGLTANQNVHCQSEYSTLEKVIVAKPSYMKITDIINETQKHYKEKNINTPLAIQQHEMFIQTLKNHQVEVIELPTDESLHEQVFTRDIGFVVDDQLFISSMSEQVRRNETVILQKWLQANEITYQEGLPTSIEGGDIIVDGTIVWVGETNRTSASSIQELQKRLSSHHIEPIQLKEEILHLDCVFNIIDETTALIYPQAFTQENIEKIKARFFTIEVTKEEQFQMGPNVLSMGGKKIISIPQNEHLNHTLEAEGFHVIRLELSEIIKSGGAFRCCTLPLKRT